MQGMTQSSARQIGRGVSPLVWEGVERSATTSKLEVKAEEINLLPELEEFLKESTRGALYVPGREGLLG